MLPASLTEMMFSVWAGWGGEETLPDQIPRYTMLQSLLFLYVESVVKLILFELLTLVILNIFDRPNNSVFNTDTRSDRFRLRV